MISSMLLDGKKACNSNNTKNVSELMDDKIERPQPMDVILGRGKSYGKHPGNVIFQDLVQSNRLRYFNSTFASKRDIITEVIRTINEKGGRFVRVKDNVWTIVPDKVSRLKIAHAIQYHIRTEFALSREVSINSEDNESTSHHLDLVPDEELSPRDRLIRAIRDRVHTLEKNQTSSIEVQKSYINDNTENHVYRTTEHPTEHSRVKETVPVLPGEILSRRQAVNSLIPRLANENVTEYESFLRDRTFHDYTQDSSRFQGLQQPCASNTPVWMKPSIMNDANTLQWQMSAMNYDTEEFFGQYPVSNNQHYSFQCLDRKADMVPTLPKIVATTPQPKDSSSLKTPISPDQGTQDMEKSRTIGSIGTVNIGDIPETPRNSWHKTSPFNEAAAFTEVGILNGLSAFSGYDGKVNIPIRRRVSVNHFPENLHVLDETSNVSTMYNHTESLPRSTTRSHQPLTSTVVPSVSTDITMAPLHLFHSTSDFSRDDDNDDDFSFA